MCPFKDDSIFDVEQVKKSLKRQKDTKFPKSLMNLTPQPQQQGCGPGQPCPPQGAPPQAMPQQGFGAQPQGIPMPLSKHNPPYSQMFSRQLKKCNLKKEKDFKIWQ